MPLIDSLELKIGPTPGAAHLQIPAAPVTLIVGPNNSGKSLLLRELNDFLREKRLPTEFHILAGIAFSADALSKAGEDISTHTIATHQDRRAPSGQFFYAKNGECVTVHGAHMEAWQTSQSPDNSVFKTYTRLNTIKLDGPNRIQLVNDAQLTDLLGSPSNRLEQLFKDDNSRRELRKVLFDAIGLYLVLDPTKLGQVRVRLSKTAPASDTIERGIHAESISFHSGAMYIRDASDGIKALCGILIELYAGNPEALLIDEPEAFLHPSLAFFLGKAAAEKAKATAKQLLVSTHSANFLMGCVQSGTSVNVVRLTYSGGIATARLLPSAQLMTFMKNPLLRSVGILNGLFYDGVVVCEGDTDRAFYNELNERLLSESTSQGARNCLFLNAQNKQTIKTILPLLRKLGIPAAGIVDIDIIKEGGTVWTSFLESANMPNATIIASAITRNALKSAFDAAGRDMKREGGIDLLSESDRASANDLFDQLESYGLFVVRNGEVESWLKNIHSGGHGPAWLLPMFDKLGDDPSSGNYVRPTNDNVWVFLKRVAQWLANPLRKGVN